MWTILLDGHTLRLLRDSWRRARAAGLTKKGIEHRAGSPLCLCEFAWNKDPALGVICIQSGPRG